MSSKKKKAGPPTRVQARSILAEKSGVAKADVIKVLNALDEFVAENLRKHKMVTINGLIKVRAVHKPAVPARPGRHPFTGEKMMFKAKPAHNKIKLTPLKRLKDMG